MNNLMNNYILIIYSRVFYNLYIQGSPHFGSLHTIIKPENYYDCAG